MGAKFAFVARTSGFVFQQFNLLPAPLTAAENVHGSAGARRFAKTESHDSRGAVARFARYGRPPQLAAWESSRAASNMRGHCEGVDPRTENCCLRRADLVLLCPHRACHHATAAATIAMERGRAVVVVTHDNRVFSFGDRIARMEDGRIVEVREQSPDERAMAEANPRVSFETA